MLSFEEKLLILESFPELERKDVSLKRVNFHYDRSAYEKKIVGFHFHPNGNGYVYAGELEGYQTDEKGFVNIRDFNVEELRSLVAQSIGSLTGQAPFEEGQEEQWIGPDKASLVVKFEDEMWYIFAGLNLEAAFDTYEEARGYLREEGFTRS
jgi:hypothetical protein